MANCDCQAWTAIHDHMPGKPVTLRVQGECTVDELGATVELRMHAPQGINPKDLLLDLIVTPPVIGAPTQNPAAVRFELETSFEYDTVSIIDCEMGIRVEDVH